MPSAVKLICGMISAEPALFDEVAVDLVNVFGPVEIAGETTPFDFTHYYDEEMGTPLFRRFLCFGPGFDPGALADAKLHTNAIEAEYAERFGAALSIRRPLNLDPGYVEPSKLVLASMKNFSHRVYLGRGVYAEVTLLYRKGRWQPLEWTFPDYASGRYGTFLSAVRNRLRCPAGGGTGR